MNESETPADEIGLLDIAVVIAESWRLLVIVPLLAGIVAYFGLSWATAPQYQSEATLRTNATGVSYFSTARVLDGPILKSELFNQFERSLSRARQALIDDRLKVTPVDGTSLYRVRLIDNHSPEEAQRFLTEILRSSIVNSTPTDTDRQRLELRKQQLETSLVELQASLGRINRLADRRLEQGSETGIDAGVGEIGQAAVAILSSIESRRVDLFNIESSLAGSISEADIVQSPTLPDSAQPRGILVAVVLAMLGVGMVILIIAFIRDGLRKASQDAASLDEVNRIRRAFWMKPLPSKPAA